MEGRSGQERTGRLEKSHATLIPGTCEIARRACDPKTFASELYLVWQHNHYPWVEFWRNVAQESLMTFKRNETKTRHDCT